MLLNGSEGFIVKTIGETIKIKTSEEKGKNSDYEKHT